MRRKTLVVEFGGVRLDRYLADALSGYSRNHIQGLIAQGCVTAGGRARSADYKVSAEEKVVLTFPDPRWPEYEKFESWILHEDEHMIVFNKPAGLLMHPLGESWLSTAQACLTEPQASLAGLLLSLRPDIFRSGVERVGIVHRLDRQTSGVLLVAKTQEAYRKLVEDFKERRIAKVYRAAVRGAASKKIVQAPIGRNPGHRRVVVTPFGKSAETAFSVLESAPKAALVEARPLTGRTHQIRAHLAYLGTPVMGDPEFDKKREGEPWPERMLLHAYRIALRHPGTGKPVQYTAALPADFRKFWRGLKKGEKS